MNTAPRKAIDWAEIHRRLAAIQAAVDRDWAPTPEAQQRLLHARARALAAPPAEAEGDALEVVEFRLGEERYGIATEVVREVFPLVELTPLPCTPPFVRGIVNAWGEIVSVIDLRHFFELPATGLTDLNRVIVVASDEMTFGILADAVLGVRRIPRAEILPALPTLTGIREDYLFGVTAGALTLLDGAKLLADRRLVVRESVEGAAGPGRGGGEGQGG